jgi:hypothetical protein
MRGRDEVSLHTASVLYTSYINASCLMLAVRYKAEGRTVLSGVQKGAVQTPRPTWHAGPILVQERVHGEDVDFV